MSFVEGQRIVCMYGGGNEYYPGVIAAANADGTFDIDYDDGEKQPSVEAAKVMDEVEAKAKGIGQDEDEGGHDEWTSNGATVFAAGDGAAGGGEEEEAAAAAATDAEGRGVLELSELLAQLQGEQTALQLRNAALLRENKRLREMAGVAPGADVCGGDGAAAAAGAEAPPPPKHAPMHSPDGMRGGIYDESFVATVRPLYDLHMGCENMGPMLYNLVRFLKPQRILEIGAGYTSIFMAQALADNVAELVNWQRLHAAGRAKCAGLQWCVDGAMAAWPWGSLVALDNLEHPDTTAHLVAEAAAKLGLSDHVTFEEEDAWGYEEQIEEGDELDMLWVDFGAGDRLHEFLARYWPRLRDGGHVLVHSTLTNALTRQNWLAQMMKAARNEGDAAGGGGGGGAAAAPAPAPEQVHGVESLGGAPPKPKVVPAAEIRETLGEFNIFSFLEPHKMYQNSFTIIQKRNAFAEPVYTVFP